MSLYPQRLIHRFNLLIALLGTLIILAGLRLPPSQAAPHRHYRADQTPPGLTATDWRQMVTQIGQQVYDRQGTDSLAQQAYLKAFNAAGGDEFGAAVAVSGNTVVAGAAKASVTGAAYVFTRSGTTWSQHAYLIASNADLTDQFGDTVAISGDTVVAGAWQESSNAVGVNGYQYDNSADFAGAAYVFLNAPAPEIAVLGNSQVILDGNRIPSFDNDTDFGHVLLGQARTHNFTIANNGNDNLALTGSPLVTLTGPTAGDFSLAISPTTTVVSNTTTSFQIRFTPSLTGTRSATLILASNDFDEDPYTFVIQGIGSLGVYLPLFIK